MTEIQNLYATELNPSEREVLAADTERWKRIGAGSHLDEWLQFGPGLLIRRRIAMKMAHTSEPTGRGYNTAMSRLMLADGLASMDGKGKVDATKKTAISCVLWFHEKAERLDALREIRDFMTPGERSRLNSPISARQRVEKLMDQRGHGREGTKRDRTSPLALAKQKIADLEREKAHVEDKLAAAERADGSLFDLRRDTAESIGKTIAGNVGESKARKIANAILEHLKKAKPAG
jgi:hypothetical protein